MSNIPTAENHFKEYFKGSGYTNQKDFVKWGVEFAKIHCDAQLNAILKNVKTKDEWEGNTGSEYCNTVVDTDSIINSYPIDNIK